MRRVDNYDYDCGMNLDTIKLMLQGTYNRWSEDYDPKICVTSPKLGVRWGGYLNTRKYHKQRQDCMAFAPIADYKYEFAIEFSKHYVGKSKSYLFATNCPISVERQLHEVQLLVGPHVVPPPRSDVLPKALREATQ